MGSRDAVHVIEGKYEAHKNGSHSRHPSGAYLSVAGCTTTSFGLQAATVALGHTPSTVNDISWHTSGGPAAAHEYIQYDSSFISISQNLSLTGDSGAATFLVIQRLKRVMSVLERFKNTPKMNA